jgi:hypothetical protein
MNCFQYIGANDTKPFFENFFCQIPIFTLRIFFLWSTKLSNFRKFVKCDLPSIVIIFIDTPNVIETFPEHHHVIVGLFEKENSFVSHFLRILQEHQETTFILF